MIILLFGPPGCGKGTQAAILAEKLHIPSISTGEMFRSECKSGSQLGKLLSSVLESGALVTDDLVNRVVAERIARKDCSDGFLLDGYPRTVPQAMYFSALLQHRRLPDPVVIHLDVKDDLLVKRLTARRQCPQCLKIYNLQSQPPAKDGICDNDGAALITREDDREEVIRRRLRAYQEQTGPILKWYGQSTVRTIQGCMPPEEVAHAIEQVVTGIRAAV